MVVVEQTVGDAAVRAVLLVLDENSGEVAVEV